jgi:putative transposase
MSRIARVVITGYPYHITQRGNYQQKTFIDKADYIHYLRWLEECKNRYNLSLLAYCLMPNHVHFIAIPEKEVSLAKTFNTCHMRYSQHFNRKSQVVGHLWQGRFYSCALDEKHLYAAIRYVETNPVRAKLVKNPEDWNWSSAKFHINNQQGILSLRSMDKLINVDNWKEYLCQNNDEKMILKIRGDTLTGRPSGDILFIQKFENLLKRKLVPAPVGRPKK